MADNMYYRMMGATGLQVSVLSYGFWATYGVKQELSGKAGIQKAKQFQSTKIKNSIAASDAFFPFADAINILIKAGVKTIIQPGGSIRDQEVINAANKAKIKMFFTGIRHFNH